MVDGEQTVNRNFPSLNQLAEQAAELIEGAGALPELENLRVHFLGKKGAVTEQLKSIAELSHEDRRSFGQAVNTLKGQIQARIDCRRNELEGEALERQLEADRVDVTQPGRGERSGTIHPISRTLERMVGIFSRLGFDVATGPEIEHDYFNFEALNMPADHPARAMHDTF